jgi:hypothetical protein
MLSIVKHLIADMQGGEARFAKRLNKNSEPLTK